MKQSDFRLYQTAYNKTDSLKLINNSKNWYYVPEKFPLRAKVYSKNGKMVRVETS